MRKEKWRLISWTSYHFESLKHTKFTSFSSTFFESSHFTINLRDCSFSSNHFKRDWINEMNVQKSIRSCRHVAYMIKIVAAKMTFSFGEICSHFHVWLIQGHWTFSGIPLVSIRNVFSRKKQMENRTAVATNLLLCSPLVFLWVTI